MHSEDGMERLAEKVFGAACIAVCTYITYRLFRSALEPPEEECRLVIGTDVYGEPIYADDPDIEKTLEMWRNLK